MKNEKNKKNKEKQEKIRKNEKTRKRKRITKNNEKNGKNQQNENDESNEETEQLGQRSLFCIMPYHVYLTHPVVGRERDAIAFDARPAEVGRQGGLARLERVAQDVDLLLFCFLFIRVSFFFFFVYEEKQEQSVGRKQTAFSLDIEHTAHTHHTIPRQSALMSSDVPDTDVPRPNGILSYQIEPTPSELIEYRTEYRTAIRFDIEQWNYQVPGTTYHIQYHTYLDSDVSDVPDVYVSCALVGVQTEGVAQALGPDVVVGGRQREVRGVVHDGVRVDPDQVSLHR